MKTRIAVLLTLLFSLLACTSPAYAEGDTLVIRQGNDVMKLLSAPCENASVRARISADLLQHFKAGHATIGGKTFALCWVPMNDGTVFVRYEDGDHGRLNLREFSREKNI